MDRRSINLFEAPIPPTVTFHHVSLSFSTSHAFIHSRAQASAESHPHIVSGHVALTHAKAQRSGCPTCGTSERDVVLHAKGDWLSQLGPAWMREACPPLARRFADVTLQSIAAWSRCPSDEMG
jgi:hypothetical protein